MPELKHILLLPADGDPAELLEPAHDDFDANPPMAWRGWQGEDDWEPVGVYYEQAGDGKALVLMWDGVPMLEGCDRFAGAMNSYPHPTWPVNGLLHMVKVFKKDPKFVDTVGTIIEVYE